MIKFNSPLYATDDFDVASDFARICAKVIYVGDAASSVTNNMLVGGVLIPPYELLALDLDRNDNFVQIYGQWLYNNPDVNQYIATIMCALMKNINVPIVLYFPGDTFNSFMYPRILLSYLNSFGINPGFISKTGSSECTYNIDSAFIVEYMYIQGAITPQEYIILSNGVTSYAGNKLRQDFNLGNISDQDLMSWYSYTKNNLLQSIK